jgi:lysophospholipase L1-like esterase
MFSPFLRFPPHLRMTLHVEAPGLSPVARYSTNRWGLRGDEPPQAWEAADTIVTVGGSTTLCLELDDRRTWPDLLQERLRDEGWNVWVGNAGQDGHSTRGHLIVMREVIPKIKPDAVVLLAGINDLGFSISEERSLLGNPFDRPTWKTRLYSSSRLVQILHTWKLVLLNRVARAGQARPYQPKPLSTQEPTLPEDLATLLPALPEYQENLRQVVRLGRAVPVRMVFLTQPMLYDDTELWRGIEGELFWLRGVQRVMSAATYWRLLDAYNQALLEVCATEGIECLDLASLIPHDAAYFYDPVHFTEAGAALVAERVSAYLQASREAKSSSRR